MTIDLGRLRAALRRELSARGFDDRGMSPTGSMGIVVDTYDWADAVWMLENLASRAVKLDFHQHPEARADDVRRENDLAIDAFRVVLARLSGAPDLVDRVAHLAAELWRIHFDMQRTKVEYEAVDAELETALADLLARDSSP